MNLASTIIPKSDQLNADDLIAGPRTIRVTEVKDGSTPEQPVSIYYEGHAGRPYKPNKSMRRVLVHIWGSEPAPYVGRSMTLFRNPTITFGKDECGGIQISHLSDIDEPKTLALTVTRGKRKPYHVLPLKADPKPIADEIDIAALEDIGESKAREGMPALAAWWESIGKSARATLGNKRLNDWKLIAEDVKL